MLWFGFKRFRYIVYTLCLHIIVFRLFCFVKTLFMPLISLQGIDLKKIVSWILWTQLLTRKHLGEWYYQEENSSGGVSLLRMTQ